MKLIRQGVDFWEAEKPSDWLPAAHKYRKPGKQELESGGLLGGLTNTPAAKPEKPRNRSLLAGGEPEKKQQSEQSGSWGSEPKKKSRNKQSGFDWFHPYGDAAPDLTGAANRKESKPKPAPKAKPASKADQPLFGPVEGHAAATLGGPDDGKVRRLDGGTGDIAALFPASRSLSDDNSPVLFPAPEHPPKSPSPTPFQKPVNPSFASF